MKKVFTWLAMAAILLSLLLMGGCAVANPGTSPSGETSASPSGSTPAASPVEESASQETIAQASPSAEAGYEFKETEYASGGISIKYPQIINLADTALQNKLNKIIADSALRDLDVIKNDSRLTDYEIVTKVTYNTPRVISMYFNGYSNYSESAHPNMFLYALIIDTEKQEKVPLKALVTINADFVKLLINGRYFAEGYDMSEEYKTEIRDYLSQDTEYLLTELRNADTSDSFATAFLTEEGLMVSVSAPHVMGDHIEILLTYKELEGYQTDNLLWKAIQSDRGDL
jgi:hypothetical protein